MSRGVARSGSSSTAEQAASPLSVKITRAAAMTRRCEAGAAPCGRNFPQPHFRTFSGRSASAGPAKVDSLNRISQSRETPRTFAREFCNTTNGSASASTASWSASFCARHLQHANPSVYRPSGDVAELTSFETEKPKSSILTNCGG